MTARDAVRCNGAMVAAVLLLPTVGSAQMFVPTGRDTLRGLPGVEVVVEELQPEIALGVSRTEIQAAVTSQLRAAGITVYPSQQDNPSPAKAYLYLHINGLALPDQEAVAVALQVQLRQTVRAVATESQIVNAMTWDAHNLVVLPASRVDDLREELHRYVTLFTDDWAAAHRVEAR